MALSTVLVPLRAPGAGKSRLAPTLSPAGRAALAGAMLADVVAVLQAAGIAEVVVAASGDAAAAAAAAVGAEVVLDPPGTTDLNVALAAAAVRLGPRPALLVVAADLPQLRVDDVTTVLRVDADVVVAPTRGGGTGGLLRRPGDRIGTAYGPGSARRHVALADAVGARVVTCHLDGFARDVDTPTDLAALHDTEVGPATARVLADLRREHPSAG